MPRRRIRNAECRAEPQGFTLVELAIVLVIIGLIVSGILAGRDLIEQAEMRHFMKRVDEIQAESNAFRMKYGQYPGDYRSAVATWGTACASNAVTTYCNGNGDGTIAFSIEGVNFWRQLGLAGMESSAYIGFVWPVPGAYAMGQDLPVVTLFGIPSSILPYPDGIAGPGGWTYLSATSNKLSPYIGSTGTGGSIRYNPPDIHHLDMKFDDGLPGHGVILSWGNGCFSSDTAYSSLIGATFYCTPWFVMN